MKTGEKMCNRCGKIKLVREFYKRDSSYRSECKECFLMDCKSRYDTDPEKHLERSKKYNALNREKVNSIKRAWCTKNPEKRKEILKKWNTENPEKIREAGRKYRDANPEKRKAYGIVQVAINKGSLLRQLCGVCGKEPTDAHHEDYDKPLDVLWYCKKHHKALHIAKDNLDKIPQGVYA